MLLWGIRPPFGGGTFRSFAYSVCLFSPSESSDSEHKPYFSHFSYCRLSNPWQKWNCWVRGSFGFLVAFAAGLSASAQCPFLCASWCAGGGHRGCDVPRALGSSSSWCVSLRFPACFCLILLGLRWACHGKRVREQVIIPTVGAETGLGSRLLKPEGPVQNCPSRGHSGGGRRAESFKGVSKEKVAVSRMFRGRGAARWGEGTACVESRGAPGGGAQGRRRSGGRGGFRRRRKL